MSNWHYNHHYYYYLNYKERWGVDELTTLIKGLELGSCYIETHTHTSFEMCRKRLNREHGILGIVCTLVFLGWRSYWGKNTCNFLHQQTPFLLLLLLLYHHLHIHHHHHHFANNTNTNTHSLSSINYYPTYPKRLPDSMRKPTTTTNRNFAQSFIILHFSSQPNIGIPLYTHSQTQS